MSQLAQAAVNASLSYIVDTGVKPVNETHGPGGLMRTQRATFDRHVVAIRDGRPMRDTLQPRHDRLRARRSSHPR